jgi:hypothetical protein
MLSWHQATGLARPGSHPPGCGLQGGTWRGGVVVKIDLMLKAITCINCMEAKCASLEAAVELLKA